MDQAVGGLQQPPELSWLPAEPDWSGRLRRVTALLTDPAQAATAFAELAALARTRVDFLGTARLDRLLLGLAGPPTGIATVRLAVLAASTVEHLLPGLRVAALRRGLHLATYVADYGQYLHELMDGGSALHRFRPTAVLLATDAVHLVGSALADDPDGTVAASLERLRTAWRVARQHFACQVIQQTALPVFPRLLGSNEHRLPGSPAQMLRALGEQLPALADAEGVDLLALDARAAEDGLAAWHDPVLWNRAKQEVTPLAAPFYGELAVRLVAARLGRSAKCLVLDLDNTLWGGVVGDDGLEGIVLGQGSALGEAYVSVQSYAKSLAARGVILAVCSKNDEATAWEPFDRHPEMILKRQDIACFVANWTDKAANLREIARRLNIGVDSLVFVDDNPAERDIVRRELPEVAVPELPDEPALYARMIADAGYFESVTLTAEDRERNSQYRANIAREALAESATDIASYLRGLEMELRWRRFDRVGLPRIVQLINKTNQFNLTTRRVTEVEIERVMADPASFGLQLRLLDRFGDNGVIAIVIGRASASGGGDGGGDDGHGLGEALAEAGLRAEPGDVVLHTWLMSCRVLGRGVEAATLDLAVRAARSVGGTRLLGAYFPTTKNAMVREHYPKLGFAPLGQAPGGAAWYGLDLAGVVAPDVPMRVTEEA